MITDKLRKDLKNAFEEALKAAIENVDDIAGQSLDDYFDDYFHRDKMDAFLTFDDPDEPRKVIVGIGDEACGSFDLQLELDPYGHLGGPRSPGQFEDILLRIKHMRSFIAEIDAACRILEGQAQSYSGPRAEKDRLL